MSALARLSALGHLDLNLLGAYQIPARHTEPSGSHLFDRGASVRIQTLNLLTALTGV